MTIIEWCRYHDVWYLQMDLEIPEVCIKEAQTVYDEGFFVDHRYGDGGGWRSAAIHSFVHKNAKDTSLGWYHTKNPDSYDLREEDVTWGWTEVAELAPETKRWLEDFPHNHYRRLRFMLLEPGGGIVAHNDSNVPRDKRGARRNIASSFLGFNKITVFKFCSSIISLFSSLKILAKYRYDFSFFGLNTISFSNLNLDLLYFFSLKSFSASAK